MSLWGAEQVIVEYFYNADCFDCRKITNLFLPSLELELGNQYKILYRDLSEEENFLHLLAYLEQTSDDSNEKMYMVINNKIVLAGAGAIEKRLPEIIKSEYSTLRQPSKINLSEPVHPRERMKLTMVIIAGLLDGINPCVFATLVFFMSLLASGAAGRGQIVRIGIIYITACFLTYLAIGLGLYKTLSWAISMPNIRMILNSVMLLGLIFFSAISFVDVVRFKRMGASGVMMQLPKRFKEFIHKLMRENRRQMFVLSGTFVLGILVTLAESVCTGQVYVPTLLFLANSEGGRWWAYLLLYNIMFIIPLIGVFVFAIWSMKIQLLLKLSKHDVVISKVLMGMFFLILAILLGYFEFFH